jgi:hypothetical protein
MATTSTSRFPVGWLLTTLGGVALVFVGGYLTAGGRPYGLALIAVAAAGFLIGRISSFPTRRRYGPRAAGVPRQRTGPTNTRRGHPAVQGRDRSEQRAVRNTARHPSDHDRVA